MKRLKIQVVVLHGLWMTRAFFIQSWIKFHRARKIYKHILNTPVENDELIYEEKDETFTCGIGITSDEKFFVISTSDHITTENHFFPVG